jgi:hypothetical protein
MLCIFFVRGAGGPKSPLMGHRTCWARENRIYLNANYRKLLVTMGLVIRDANLDLPSKSNFYKRVDRPRTIQHIIGTHGASYRACYPSTG